MVDAYAGSMASGAFAHLNNSIKISGAELAPRRCAEQVVGSASVTKYQLDAAGRPSLLKTGKGNSIDDGAKPAGINMTVAAVRSSPSAIPGRGHQMLQWTAGEKRPAVRQRTQLRHTDAAREYACDRRQSGSSTRRGTGEGKGVDRREQKSDWKTVFPFEIKVKNRIFISSPSLSLPPPHRHPSRRRGRLNSFPQRTRRAPRDRGDELGHVGVQRVYGCKKRLNRASQILNRHGHASR